MATPRSLLHLNGANGSTTVTNSVTGGSAIAWAFAGAGALTTSAPYLGSAMAALPKYSYLNSATVAPSGDWTLAFRLRATNDADSGQSVIVSQGSDGATGAWYLAFGSGGNDLYLMTTQAGGGSIDGTYNSGGAAALTAKMTAGNCFLVVQWIGGVFSVGLAGSGDGNVTQILSGAFLGGNSPAGAFHFNSRFTSAGVASQDNSNTQNVDEVIYQDGGAIWPTYPFAKPTTEYSFGPVVTGAIVDAKDVAGASAQASVKVAGAIQDRRDAAAGMAAATVALSASGMDAPDLAFGTATAAASVIATLFDVADTPQASAAASSSAVAAAQDAEDQFIATGQTAVAVSTVAVDAFDIAAGQAFVGAAPVAVEGFVVDAVDTLQAAASLSIGTAFIGRDSEDTLRSTANGPESAALVLTDAADTVDSAATAGALPSSATLASVESPDLVASMALAQAVAAATAGDASDALFASARGAVVAAVTTADVDDILSGSSIALPAFTFEYSERVLAMPFEARIVDAYPEIRTIELTPDNRTITLFAVPDRF